MAFMSVIVVSLILVLISKISKSISGRNIPAVQFTCSIMCGYTCSLVNGIGLIVFTLLTSLINCYGRLIIVLVYVFFMCF